MTYLSKVELKDKHLWILKFTEGSTIWHKDERTTNGKAVKSKDIAELFKHACCGIPKWFKIYDIENERIWFANRRQQKFVFKNKPGYLFKAGVKCGPSSSVLRKILTGKYAIIIKEIDLKKEAHCEESI